MLLNVLNFFIVYCEKAAQNYYQLSKEFYSARVFVKDCTNFIFKSQLLQKYLSLEKLSR